MRYLLILTLLVNFAHFSISQLSATASSTVNTNCNGSDCTYSGPSILINELMISPTVNDGSICGAGGGGAARGEWIELYNPNLCQPVDISCYYLGNNTSEGTGGYVIPSGTVVPAGGFCVIRGSNMTAVPSGLLVANGGNVVELVVPTNTTDAGVCTSGTRVWFPNAGGWFAFYDSNGVPQDAVSWVSGVTTGQNGAPCVAALAGCSYSGTLASYNAIPAARKNLIYTPVVPNSWGLSLERSTDGGTWSGVGATPSYGTCNGTCISPIASTCTGTATVTPTGGIAPYTYAWNDSHAQTTQTATGLCAGSYTCTITDNTGTTTSISVTVLDFEPTVTPTNNGPVCETSPSVNLNETSGNVTTWSWSASGSASFSSTTSQTPTASNVANGEVFTVTGTNANGCTGSETTTVTLLNAPTASNLTPTVCESVLGSGTASGIDLTANNSAISSDAGVTLTWYADPALTTLVNTPSNASVSNGQVFYVNVALGSCSAVGTVTYTVTSTITLVNPADVMCESPAGSASFTGYDLTTLNSSVYSGSGITTYAWFASDMVTPVGTPNNVTITSSSTYYVSVADGNCSNGIAVTFTVNAAAPADAPSPVLSCDTYVLPALSPGNNYYTAANGGGTMLNAGDILTASQNLFIYTQTGGSPNCTDENTFVITINSTPSLATPAPITICDSYTLPLITGTNLTGTQSYYTGSNGSGTQFSSGDNITSTQTIYVYDNIAGCSDQESFLVTINNTPVPDNPADAVNCDGYILPSLTVGSYYAGPGATGTNYIVGDTLYSSQLVYVYAETGTTPNCLAENSFQVTVNNTPPAPIAGTDSTYCSTYELAPMTVTGTGGTFTWYTNAALSNQLGVGPTATPNQENGTSVYYVTETVNGCMGPADAVTIIIEDCEIIVPTAFTPDGDNANDVWEIVGLDEIYKDNQVFVYNRWGGLIFQSEKGKYSTKPWDGTYNGEKMPVASYYFIIDFNDESFKPAKGIVSIVLDK
jgi:gliding motility-associated-like protein